MAGASSENKLRSHSARACGSATSVHVTTGSLPSRWRNSAPVPPAQPLRQFGPAETFETNTGQDRARPGGRYFVSHERVAVRNGVVGHPIEHRREAIRFQHTGHSRIQRAPPFAFRPYVGVLHAVEQGAGGSGAIGQHFFGVRCRRADAMSAANVPCQSRAFRGPSGRPHAGPRHPSPEVVLDAGGHRNGFALERKLRRERRRKARRIHS